MERNPTNPSPAATLRIIEARRDTRRCLAALAVLALLVVGGPAAAQFTAGSDGSDGALDFTGRCSGTLLWDASETRPDGQVLDPEGDGIFHFTTVTVPQGCTLRMLASRLGHKPIQWLVQGNVSISGDLNLDGTDGHSNQEGVALRLPAVPGPGGFAGGSGAWAETPMNRALDRAVDCRDEAAHTPAAPAQQPGPALATETSSCSRSSEAPAAEAPAAPAVGREAVLS